MDLKRLLSFNKITFVFFFCSLFLPLHYSLSSWGKKLIEIKALKHFKRVVLKVTRLGIFFLIFNKKKIGRSINCKINTEKNRFDKVAIY